MSRASASKTALPEPSRKALVQLGRDLVTARIRRRLPQQLMADRMLISRGTLRRLEAGDPTVGLGVLASALFILGMTNRLEDIIAADLDRAGISEEVSRLPRHAHSPQDPDLDF